MKQIIQNLQNGQTILEEVPAPQVRPGCVLIQTRRSLVSLGTERMLVEFGQAGLIQKARQQPERVKLVLDKIRTDGLLPTLEAVFNKLGQPLPLGYCNVGKVLAVGQGVADLQIGDRVASNGPHAEVVCVPRNLVAKVPDAVSDDEAAFTVIGAIGLQGIRLLNPTLGETVVVVGLGLIGLLTAELLRLNGCRVVGIDLDEAKLQVARAKGILTCNPSQGDDPVKFVEALTQGVGTDGVIITASAKTNELVSQAARMSRKRGRIILVGVTGLHLSRAEFYEKELSFQVSCSYGPGRYDDTYEQQGTDYPLPFVRWTENRNFQAILQLLAARSLDVGPLISEIVPLEEYQKIYGALGTSGAIASLLRYPEEVLQQTVVRHQERSFAGRTGVLGIIGAGNFTQMTLLPILKGTSLKYIASANGLSGTSLAQKHGIAHSTTDYHTILQDDEVDLVLITTRHHQHARLAQEALKAGKHVFVEKPLAIFQEELDELIQTYQALEGTPRSLTVGFNRRFSPHAQKMKALLGQVPMNVVATMNAGFIPTSSWVHDRAVGGGRILGEACHFVDLITYLTGSRVVAVCMNVLGTQPTETTDNATLLLKYENGSTGVINYFANGSKAYAKERVEVYAQERTLVLDNFRMLTGYGFKGFTRLKTPLDKGHKNLFGTLLERVKTGGAPLIPFDELVNTTQTTLAALESLRRGEWVRIE
ncbi:bi-domain-containing oxidoreductase [Rhabdobacter roseus]|uniref:Putative dehydrogenase/threonine dehydrogenase-like Zn-dependent dehydrogenase n=1 Tax=Rhabdobacter roseus TaxID=1655419 RepID=A0A840TCZ1_9BACT|nr:bi-domain-containing oxidoreductase [Rhabdobacter roseus]MBB5281946.1 putative dehydrogenase/threonine dehydrogenase-like Zn-dependent dehydrogenase [Rhabdobacter roseus]